MAWRCYLRLQFAISIGWGQDEQCRVLIVIFYFYNFIHQRLGADIAIIPSCSNTRSLYVTLKKILHIFKHPWLCRPDPTLFLAHCKAHKTPTQSQPCKELKIPKHSPPHSAGKYLSSFIQLSNNKSLLSNQDHPPPIQISAGIFEIIIFLSFARIKW